MGEMQRFFCFYCRECPKIASSASAHLDGQEKRPVQMRAGFSLSPSSPSPLSSPPCLNSPDVASDIAGLFVSDRSGLACHSVSDAFYSCLESCAWVYNATVQLRFEESGGIDELQMLTRLHSLCLSAHCVTQRLILSSSMCL